MTLSEAAEIVAGLDLREFYPGYSIAHLKLRGRFIEVVNREVLAKEFNISPDYVTAIVLGTQSYWPQVEEVRQQRINPINTLRNDILAAHGTLSIRQTAERFGVGTMTVRNLWKGVKRVA